MILHQETDPLTGLTGYDGLSRRLELLIRPRKGNPSRFSLGLFDLDGFGEINRRHGREAGDALLRQLAAHLAEAVGARGEVARWGGDAFAVLLPGIEKEEAFLLLEEARAAFAAGRLAGAGEGALNFEVSVSGGVAAAPDDSADLQDLLRKVQAALYRAKVQGPGKLCLAREEKMVTKTSHYGQGQLEGLTRLAKRLGQGEAALLREALDDLLRKYNG
jgi:diguanylate cyclase (GGDEF)-like protein